MNGATERRWRWPVGVLAACVLAACALLLTAPSSFAQASPASQPDNDARQLLQQARQQAHAMEFDHAFRTFQQAVDASRRLGDRRSEAEALLSLGLTHRQAGAPALAVRWIQEALAVLEHLDADADHAEVLCELARTRNAVGERREARRHLDDAETLFKGLGDRAGQGRVNSLRSLVAVHDGRFDDTIRFGQRARDNPHTPGGDRLRAASSVAYALQQQKRWQDALAAYDAALELAWERNDQSQIGYAYCNRAEVRWQLGKSKPALEDLWRAVHGFEQARLLIPSTGEQKSAFIGRQINAYDRLIRYLVDTSQPDVAFEVAERFHARSFLEMLDQRANERLRGRHPELATHRERLLDDLGEARLSLEETGSGDSDLLQKLTDLETELLTVEAQLLWHDRDPRQQAPTPTPTQQQVQQGLSPGEALVAYWVSDERLMAWTVLDGTTRLSQMPISRTELRDAVRDYLGPLRSPELAADLAVTGRETEHLGQGQKLHEWLVGSLPQEVQEAGRWIVVPDDVLHYLPFEALVLNCDEPSSADAIEAVHSPYAQCRYLGLERPLAYSPSAGAFLALRQRLHRRQGEDASSPPRTLLAMAPSPSFVEGEAVTEAARLRNGLLWRAPLVHARQEAERIAALFPTSSSWFEDEAGEGRLKQEARNYRFLHLATHGLVDDQLPMSSGLLLSADDGEDGLLQAHEVLGLELEADLVTLSACRSGRGRLQRGEGVVGLSRAFLTAGASAVVVSQWDIDDRSTPQLMEHFYRYVAAGLPAPEALVKARRHLFGQQGTTRLVLRERPVAYAHPRFWASFVLSGGF